jgi:anaerobic selenocysteine-containing dehydrogenase
MNAKISRRHFIKLASSAATIATVSGCMPAGDRLVEILEPHNRPPEETLPGVATWYASTCRQCPSGCGIVVRTVNGRAKKIEGNPLHPLNRGKLCARGQAGLQTLYNPDRLQQPVQQTGGRGSRQFEPLHWEKALETLHRKVQEINPGRQIFYGGIMPDHLYFLVSNWLEAQGASPPVTYDLYSALEGRGTAAKSAEILFGTSQLPVYDVTNASAVYSFGANFLETWQSAVAYGRAYGEFRQGQAGRRGFLVQFEPRLSATGASADEWVPLRPGTDGLVALAIGRIIVELGLGNVGTFGQAQANLFQSVDVGELAEASDVSAETLERLARTLADSDRPLAIPGGYPAGQHNDLDAYQAIQALNLILSRLGQQGGVFLSQSVAVPTLQTAPPPDSFESVVALIDKLQSGEVDLLFIYGANPLFDLPTSAGFREAIQRVPYVVSFSPFVDESAVWSDLILPDHTYLESWGYQVPNPGTDRPVVSSQQPVVSPIYNTRSTADIILTLAAATGGAVAEALPWADERLYLEDTSGALFGSSISAYGSDSAGAFWSAWRQQGGWWSEKELRQEPEPVGFGDDPIPVSSPIFENDEDTYPFHLYPYPTVGISDGRGANSPWLQELPDPMTTARWQTWIDINPETAHKLGIDDNDVVKVTSPFGEISAVAVLYPGIRPDVVAIPVGQGHSDYGRYAQDRGSNVADLLAPSSSPKSGSLAWGTTRVQIEPTDQTYELARLESIEGEGRESIR